MVLSSENTGTCSKNLLLIIVDRVYQEKQHQYKTVYKYSISCLFYSIQKESKSHELTAIYTEAEQSKQF